MADDDTEEPTEPAFPAEVKNLLEAMQPLLHRLSGMKKALRILGGVTSITKPAVRAWAARCHRWQTQDLVQEAEIVARATGLPTPVVLRNLAQQRDNDLMMLSALRQIGSDPGPSDGDPADPVTDKGPSTPDGWFHALSQEATTADEGFGREAFVRILAGEIRDPGSFSVRTMRVLGALSQSTARNFQWAVSASIQNIDPNGGVRDVRIPAVGGSLGQNCLLEEGLSYDILIDMTENGLLHPDYNCWHYYGPYGFTHQGLRWGLVPKGDPKAPEIKMKGAKFTTCGVELLKIVDIEPLPAFTTKLIKHFSQSGYDMVKAKS